MAFDRKVPITVLVFALLGCGGDGVFRKGGFYNDRHPYRVSSPQTKGLLAGRGWVVDNYEKDDGEIGDEKTSPRYRAFANIDQDEDGIPDEDLVFPAYDLLLRNVKHAGRIWIRTLPLPSELQNTELRVLALDFIDAVGASGRITAQLSFDPSDGGGRRLVTRVVEGYDARLDGESAYEVSFDSADVDQVRFADDGRYRRTRMIVLRPDFDFFDGRERFPLLMLIGYSNRVEDFSRGDTDFERLVSGIDLLSEPELVKSRTAALFECVDDDVSKLEVYIDVDKRGRVEWADTQAERKVEYQQVPAIPCAQEVLERIQFRDKGERRRLMVLVERGKTSMRARGYARIEQRPTAPVAGVKRQRVPSGEPQPVRVTQQQPPVAVEPALAPIPVTAAAVAAAPAAVAPLAAAAPAVASPAVAAALTAVAPPAAAAPAIAATASAAGPAAVPALAAAPVAAAPAAVAASAAVAPVVAAPAAVPTPAPAPEAQPAPEATPAAGVN